MRLLAGVALAALASAFYNLGLVVQAQAARVEPAGSGLGVGLIVRLLRRSRWLVGTALVTLGWPLQALALLFAPLTVVQPALAVGLVLPLAAAARLGDPVRRRDVWAVAAVIAGVALLVVAAPPRETRASTWAVVVALAALGGVAVLAPLVARGRARGSALVVAAGLAFSGNAVATKLASDVFARHAWLVLVAWAVVALVAGVLGTAAETGALQLRSAGGVAAVVFALETAVPVALAPLLFGERWGGSWWGVVARTGGIVLALAGAADLTRAVPHPAPPPNAPATSS